MDEEEGLEPNIQIIAARAANEGVPVGAIARICQRPFTAIWTHLKLSVSIGAVGTMPKPDWPPLQSGIARLPTVQRTSNIDDIEHACRQTFHLTPLELAFMIALLRHTFADKEKLHTVVENQPRNMRPERTETRPVKMVDVMICKLRAKLKTVDERFVVHTVWGKGYYIDPAVKDLIYERINVSGGVPVSEDQQAVSVHAAL